jgi:hypothetical protein
MHPWSLREKIPFPSPDNEVADSGDASMGDEEQQFQQSQGQYQKL